MKENPAMKKVVNNMRPGVISLHGFLGDDKRDIEQIIEHDAAELEKLGMIPDEVADKLQEIMEKALGGLGDFISLKAGYEAKADSIRGKLPCPFSHPGLFRKTVITVRNAETGEEFLYTDLGIHLIRDHCFFQGKGSPFRIEPVKLQVFLQKV
ncbi:MAG: hypothetical protein JEZ04_17870 [Spirochaetales bacterium]|nr:hypothetical protein [Spirochaetales bacterium]